MLWARPACFYCCQCLVCINVTCACAITQFIYCVEFRRWRRIFFVWVWLVLVDMASRTIRIKIRSRKRDLLVVLFVAAQACRCVRAVVLIGWRQMSIWQDWRPRCCGMTRFTGLRRDEVAVALANSRRMRAIVA
jgi:hypothetical protein